MSTPVFSASANGLEFLAIDEDGTVSTRHRREDGVIHWHRQRHKVFPEILHLQGPMESWRAEILPLPPEARTPGTPPFVAILFRTGFERLIPFAFPFVALSEDAVGRILTEVPAIFLLVHDSDVSCTRDRYEIYRDIEESPS
jgi:hypothetical protein